MATTVNADKLFLAAIGEVPYTAEWASTKIRELQDAGELKPEHGILKRLLAAATSVTRRGIAGEDWSFVPSERWCRENGAVREIGVSGTFRASSTGGTWSRRVWNWECELCAVEDECGVESITPIDRYFSPRAGRVTVGSNRHVPCPKLPHDSFCDMCCDRGVVIPDDDEKTTFVGISVAFFAAAALRRHIVHRWVEDVVDAPEAPISA